MGVTAIRSGNMQEKVWHGTCESTSSEGTKVVTGEDGFKLKEGTKIQIYFANGNSVNDMLLDVNNTGGIDAVMMDGGSIGSFIRPQSYVSFTYVSNAGWNSGEQAFPFWIVDNARIAGPFDYGSVRLSDRSSSQGATSGIAVTPKALQAVKDIADAALPKAGGSLTGSIDIEDQSGSKRSQIFIAQGQNNAMSLEVNETNSTLEFATAKTGIKLNAGVNIATEDIQAKTVARISLESSDNPDKKALQIVQNVSRRLIANLTEPLTDTDAANKEYVDKLSKPWIAQASGNGKQYLRTDEEKNPIKTFVIDSWYFEFDTTVVKTLKITVSLNLEDSLTNFVVYGYKDVSGTVEQVEIMRVKGTGSVSQTICWNDFSAIGGASGEEYGAILGSIEGDSTKVLNPVMIIQVAEKI